ncbi:MAG: site-specific integrase [Alphaproteobacteria bacterium]
MNEHAPHTKSPETIAYAADRLLEFFANNVVGDITIAKCREYLQYRQSGKQRVKVSVGSVKRELDVLQAAINYDYKNGTLTAPRPVWKPPLQKSKERWLTKDEAKKLFTAAEESNTEYLPLFIALALYTGARKAAILQLKWSQVDLINKRIDYNAVGDTQSNKKRALIPIAEPIIPLLIKAKERGLDNGYVIHINQKPIKDIKRSFNNACKKANLYDVTPHTLRHTCATWLAQAGVPFPEIAKYIGHNNSRTTENIYAHHSPDYLKNAVNVFNKT